MLVGEDLCRRKKLQEGSFFQHLLFLQLRVRSVAGQLSKAAGCRDHVPRCAVLCIGRNL